MCSRRPRSNLPPYSIAGKEQKRGCAKSLGFKQQLLIPVLPKGMNLHLVSFVIIGVPILGMVSLGDEAGLHLVAGLGASPTLGTFTLRKKK